MRVTDAVDKFIADMASVPETVLEITLPQSAFQRMNYEIFNRLNPGKGALIEEPVRLTYKGVHIYDKSKMGSILSAQEIAEGNRRRMSGE